MNSYVTIRSLSETEAAQANKEAKATFWSFPIALSIGILIVAALLHWLFDAPWEVAWWCIGGVFSLYFIAKLFAGSRGKIVAGVPVVERRGNVVRAAVKGNRPLSKVNSGQYLEMALEPVVLPEPYPQRDTFEVWQNDYPQLVGREVLITYLPDTGAVLSFELLSTHGNPLMNGERVTVTYGTVKITRSNGHNESIALDDVDYIAVYSHSETDPNDLFFLNLRSYHAMGACVSSSAKGFLQLEETLARELVHFDAERYHISKWHVSSDASVVWKRPLKADAHILHPLSPGDLDDIQRGIHLENPDKLVLWGTFGELDAMTRAKRRGMSFPNTLYRGYEFAFVQPTVFGLQVRELITETPSWSKDSRLNPRWPVTAYRTDISLGNGGREDLEILTAHFSAALGRPDDQSHPDRDGDASLWVSWARGEVTIKLTVWKPYQSDDYRSGCQLEITREPDLTEFYVTDYTKNFQLHDQLHYLILDGKLDIPASYIHYTTVKYLPEALKSVVPSDNQYIVWRDERYGMFGIGNRAFAHILALSQVRELHFVGEYWRDAPTGLSVYVKTIADTTGTANYIGCIEMTDEQWATIQEQLSTWLQLPATYTENRQYY